MSERYGIKIVSLSYIPDYQFITSQVKEKGNETWKMTTLNKANFFFVALVDKSAKRTHFQFHKMPEFG